MRVGRFSNRDNCPSRSCSGFPSTYTLEIGPFAAELVQEVPGETWRCRIWARRVQPGPAQQLRRRIRGRRGKTGRWGRRGLRPAATPTRGHAPAFVEVPPRTVATATARARQRLWAGQYLRAGQRLRAGPGRGDGQRRSDEQRGTLPAVGAERRSGASVNAPVPAERIPGPAASGSAVPLAGSAAGCQPGAVPRQPRPRHSRPASTTEPTSTGPGSVRPWCWPAAATRGRQRAGLSGNARFRSRRARDARPDASRVRDARPHASRVRDASLRTDGTWCRRSRPGRPDAVGRRAGLAR